MFVIFFQISVPLTKSYEEDTKEEARVSRYFKVFTFCGKYIRRLVSISTKYRSCWRYADSGTVLSNIGLIPPLSPQCFSYVW